MAQTKKIIKELLEERKKEEGNIFLCGIFIGFMVYHTGMVSFVIGLLTGIMIQKKYTNLTVTAAAVMNKGVEYVGEFTTRAT